MAAQRHGEIWKVFAEFDLYEISSFLRIRDMSGNEVRRKTEKYGDCKAFIFDLVKYGKIHYNVQIGSSNLDSTQAYKVKQIFRESDEPEIDLHKFALNNQLNFNKVFNVASSKYGGIKKSAIAYWVDRDERDIKRNEYTYGKFTKEHMHTIYMLRAQMFTISEISSWIKNFRELEIADSTIYKILNGLIYTDPKLRPDNYFKNAHLRFQSERDELISAAGGGDA